MDCKDYKMMTLWRNNKLVCCCLIENQCSKNHGCEENVFTLDPYNDIEKCMHHSSYKRSKGGAIRQVRRE